MKYIPKKKVLFNVQCQSDSKHIFEKVFELEENQERPEKQSEVEAFCPYCSKIVEVTVKEKAPLNQEILKRFEEQDRALGLK
jgi:ribosomal protein L44E